MRDSERSERVISKIEWDSDKDGVKRNQHQLNNFSLTPTHRQTHRNDTHPHVPITVSTRVMIRVVIMVIVQA